MKNLLLLLVFSVIKCSFSANILYINAFPSPSHFIWNRALMYGLAAKGHNITSLGVNTDHKPPENVHFIHLEDVYEQLSTEKENVDFFEFGKMSTLSLVTLFDTYAVTVCKILLKTNGHQTLKNYPDNFKFDLVINDYLSGPCLLPFLHKFNYPPLVQVTAFYAQSQTSILAGSLAYPGITPNHELDSDENMSMVKRIENFIVSMWELICKEYYLEPETDKLVGNEYPGLPSVSKLNKMTKLVLLNSHPVIQFTEPAMPNVISVGGLQIQKVKALPDDLKAVIEKAKNGVILFSLGSNVRSDSLGDERLISILLAMKELSQYQFLWKFESDKLPIEVPKNVFIKAWMPQSDILAHPNVKLFISHCGLLSTQEAVWHGVPVVGLPVFVDQFRNINYMSSVGVGKRASIVDLRTEDLVSAVKEVLGNPSYRNNMKKLSDSFKDQPETGLERAVWWIEWVLRNPDSDFIRSPAIHLSIMQKNAYDVILVIFGGIVVTVLLLAFVLSKLLKMKSGLGKAKTA